MRVKPRVLRIQRGRGVKADYIPVLSASLWIRGALREAVRWIHVRCKEDVMVGEVSVVGFDRDWGRLIGKYSVCS